MVSSFLHHDSSFTTTIQLLEMDLATRVQDLGEAVYILHTAYSLRKGINLNIFHPAMIK